MKGSLIILVCWLALSAQAAQDCVNFDDTKPGTVPEGWQATETGIGTAHWSVEKDETAASPKHVLKQSGEAEFPICIFQKVEMADGFIEVKFKPVAGKEDQAGGVIFRVKDKDDYYIVRANALEDSVVLFHTLRGHREQVKSIDIKVASQQWHKLRVEFRGRHIKVYFENKLIMETDDESLKGSGKIGVWTKSDSVTLFDDFCFGELK
jgi:Domain of Unknown Function (DUF1080)